MSEITYSVVDSGPATAKQPWRRIEFQRTGFETCWSYMQRMSPLEVEHAIDGPADFLTWWNEGFMREAFTAFYVMTPAVDSGWATAPKEA